MEISTSFEKHLPDQLYTVLEERELLDDKKHCFMGALSGSFKVSCNDNSIEKEYTVVEIQTIDPSEPQFIQSIFLAYQEKRILSCREQRKHSFTENEPNETKVVEFVQAKILYLAQSLVPTV